MREVLCCCVVSSGRWRTVNAQSRGDRNSAATTTTTTELQQQNNNNTTKQQQQSINRSINQVTHTIRLCWTTAVPLTHPDPPQAWGLFFLMCPMIWPQPWWALPVEASLSSSSTAVCCCSASSSSPPQPKHPTPNPTPPHTRCRLVCNMMVKTGVGRWPMAEHNNNS